VYEAWHNPFPALVGPVKSHKQAEREDRKRRNHKLPESPNRPEVPSPPRRRIDHFVMNLPGTALEFLDAFRGSFASIRDEAGFGEVYNVMPMIHCHCFTRELERLQAETDIREVCISQHHPFVYMSFIFIL
jgi:tRNA (guanine37-N1)-methyltransferase